MHDGNESKSVQKAKSSTRAKREIKRRARVCNHGTTRAQNRRRSAAGRMSLSRLPLVLRVYFAQRKRKRERELLTAHRFFSSFFAFFYWLCNEACLPLLSNDPLPPSSSSSSPRIHDIRIALSFFQLIPKRKSSERDDFFVVLEIHFHFGWI